EQALVCDANGEPQPERALIAYGQHTEGCRIFGPADRDTFTFAGTAGDLVRLNVHSTTPHLDLRLELRDATGVLVVDTSCSGEGGSGAGIQCSISEGRFLVTTGIFSITISNPSVDETGGYVFQLERIPPTSGPPHLPYNSPVAVRDVVDQPTDLDFFVFDGVAGTTIQLTLSSRTPRLDPRLEVRDPTGAFLIDNFCSGEDGSGDGVLCPVAAQKVLPVTGRYLVIVSDNGLDETGTYDLALNCISGGCPTTHVNSPPRLATIGAKSVANGQLLTFTISATDPD